MDIELARLLQADAISFYGMRDREVEKDYYKIGVIDSRIATVISGRIKEYRGSGFDNDFGAIY